MISYRLNGGPMVDNPLLTWDDLRSNNEGNCPILSEHDSIKKCVLCSTKQSNLCSAGQPGQSKRTLHSVCVL